MAPRPGLPALLALTALLGGSTGALACSCAPVTPEKGFSSADAVFRGRVVDVSRQYHRVAWHLIQILFGAEPDDEEYETSHGVRVKFRVLESWKGSGSQQLEVFTGRGDPDCGIPFREDTEYLVFAYAADRGKLVTGQCTLTKPVDESSTELEFLRRFREAS